MSKFTRVGFIVFLLLAIALAITGHRLPRDTLIIDNFDDKDIKDWNETAFETESYNVTDIYPRSNVADIEIKIGQNLVCNSANNITIYCKYGSFQKVINSNLKGYEKSELSYYIKFDNYFNEISQVSLSLGEVVSGGNQTNKVDFFYKPITNDWQKVSFKLQNPSSKIGSLNYEDIKRIRFNIAYNDNFYRLNTTFHVYIDDITLEKYSSKSLIFFALSIIYLLFAFLSLKIKDKKEKIHISYRKMFSLTPFQEEILNKIVNQTFQSTLVIYLILLLAKEFYPIKFINFNYLLVIVLILGVFSIFFPIEKKEVKDPELKDYIMICFLGIIGAILIYIKTKQLGWLSYLISIIAGILIILLSHLVLDEDEPD